jgi:glycosyltransferase involved in cell wall biosynthesis
MYLLSGNAIVMSDTFSQKKFIKQYPNVGLLYERENPNSLLAALKEYIDCPELLQKHRNASLKLSKSELNWNFESNKWFNMLCL